MSTKYTYSISTDFVGLIPPYTSPSTSRLSQEIESSAIVTALDYINTFGDDCDIWFKAALSSGDEDILDALVAAHTGEPLPASEFHFDSDGNIKTSDQPRCGSSKNFYMPNMTDPCCWYEGSVEVPDQALTDDGGDHKTWSGPVGHKWIDLFHHRVHDEHALDRDAYKPVIEVSADAGQTWTPVDECHQAWDVDTEQYDYTLIPVDEVFIHYGLSKVVFGASQDGKLVRASYYRSNGFKFTVKPDANKRVDIIYAEVQGSKDLVFTCAVVFKVYMYIEGMGVVEVARSVYGTMWNYIDEARGNWPICQAMGGKYRYGEVRRGMAQDSMLMPFPYQTKSTLLSSAQMKIVVEFEEGAGPWLGEHGTGTFYCISSDEA